MDQPSLLQLFSVPVYVADNIGGQTTVQDLKDFAMSDNRPGMQNLSDEMNVLGYFGLETLRSAIHAQVLQYLCGYLGVHPKYGIQFVSSWVSKLKRYSHHTEHIHPCSQWSGVYYPVDQDIAASLEFWPPLGEVNWLGGTMVPDIKAFTPYTNSHAVIPTPGDRLVLFPSDLPHKVSWPANITKEERYSLAFNIMLSGEYTTAAQTVRLHAEPL